MTHTLYPVILKILAILLLPALGLLLPSCATDDEEPIPVTKTGEVMRPRLVGRIATVPSDKRFILIQSYGNWKVAAGTVLISQGTEGRTANLLATGETMGQYAAADVQSGDVQRGDAVYSRDFSKPAPPEAPTTPNTTAPNTPAPVVTDVPVP